MVIEACYVTGCPFQTGDRSESSATAVLTHHLNTVHPAAPALKAPPLKPPTFKQGTSVDEWNRVCKEWDLYKGGSNILETKMSLHILNCCEEDLKANICRGNPEIAQESEEDVLKIVKALAVGKVAPCVLQSQMLSLKQERGEAVQHFAARIWGKARNCDLKLACSCRHCGQKPNCVEMIDFSELVVRMVLTNGIENEDIKREVLGTDKVEALTLAEMISLIETKECAARSLISEENTTKETAAATSSYKKIAKTDPRLQATDKCKGCGEKFRTNVIRSRRGKDDEIHTFKSCKDCYLSEKKRLRERKRNPKTTPEEQNTEHWNSDTYAVVRSSRWPQWVRGSTGTEQ